MFSPAAPGGLLVVAKVAPAGGAAGVDTIGKVKLETVMVAAPESHWAWAVVANEQPKISAATASDRFNLDIGKTLPLNLPERSIKLKAAVIVEIAGTASRFS